MSQSMCLVFLAVGAVLSPSTIVVAQPYSVIVQLEYTSLENSGCIGGPVLGLTETSVMLQYMEMKTSGVPSLQEWINLAVINVTLTGQSFPVRITRFLTLGSSCSVRQGVQFRLLQLEHGGGGCNCWSLDSMSVTLAGELRVFVPIAREEDICFTTGINAVFCELGAGEPRGLVTRVLYFPGSDGTRCVSDTLLATKGPPQPINCFMETPHL